MGLSWSEIRTRAADFAREWAETLQQYVGVREVEGRHNSRPVNTIQQMLRMVRDAASKWPRYAGLVA